MSQSTPAPVDSTPVVVIQSNPPASQVKQVGATPAAAQQQKSAQAEKKRQNNKPKQQNKKQQNGNNNTQKQQKQQKQPEPEPEPEKAPLAAQMLICQEKIASQIIAKFMPSDKSPALLALPIKFPTFAEFITNSIFNPAKPLISSKVITKFIADNSSLDSDGFGVFPYRSVSFGLNAFTFQFLNKNWSTIQHQVKKNDRLLSLVHLPTSASTTSLHDAKIEITGYIGMGTTKNNEDEQQAAFRHAKNASMIILNDTIGHDLDYLDYGTVKMEVLHENNKTKELYAEPQGVNIYLRRIKEDKKEGVVYQVADFVDAAMLKSIKITRVEAPAQASPQKSNKKQQAVQEQEQETNTNKNKRVVKHTAVHSAAQEQQQE